MSLTTGLTTLFIGAFLLLMGMYLWASGTGQALFFVGLSLALAGICISVLRAGRQRR